MGLGGNYGTATGVISIITSLGGAYFIGGTCDLSRYHAYEIPPHQLYNFPAHGYQGSTNSCISVDTVAQKSLGIPICTDNLL